MPCPPPPSFHVPSSCSASYVVKNSFRGHNQRGVTATNFGSHCSLTRFPATAMRCSSILASRAPFPCGPVIIDPLSILQIQPNYDFRSAYTPLHSRFSESSRPTPPFVTPARSRMALYICGYPESYNLVPTIHRRYPAPVASSIAP